MPCSSPIEALMRSASCGVRRVARALPGLGGSRLRRAASAACRSACLSAQGAAPRRPNLRGTLGAGGMTDLRADGAPDLRAPGAANFRPPADGATDFRQAGGRTDFREAGGGATDFREVLAFAEDLSLFLGMGRSL